MSKHRVLFIGAINENKSPLGGEEYKNQLILSKLKSEYIDLKYVDTILWKKSTSTVYRLFKNLFFSDFDLIVISASSVSTYRLLKLINFIRPQILKKISYLVIGGYFPVAVETGQFKNVFYEKLKCIIVEGEYLKAKLSKYLLCVPIFVIPNFKYFPRLDFLNKGYRKLFRFVFVGRICKEKGVDLIFNAAKKIEFDFEKYQFQIDFFGPIEGEYKFNEICSYKGYLDFINYPEKCYKILSNYDCLLFPTLWKGEGFPGVIIDAYIAGLSIIASEWNMNSEVIKNGINGYLIPANNELALIKKMIWMMDNKEITAIMGNNNRAYASRFHIENIWSELFSILNS